MRFERALPSRFTERVRVTSLVAAALLGVVLRAAPAEARVFDLTKESFAAYFSGTFGTSAVGSAGYANSSGAGTDIDKAVQSQLGGEFGLVFSGMRFNFKLGGEYLSPRTQEGVTGTDSSSTQLFLLTSKISAFIPTAAIEYMAYRGPAGRLLFGLGYGWAIAYLDNQYTMTSVGKSKFGVGDYIESGRESAPMVQAYAGYEFSFTDTTTLTFLGGYRMLKVATLKATKDTTAIVGSEPSGSDLVNGDGSRRSLDLSGGYVGLTFRFYLGH